MRPPLAIYVALSRWRAPLWFVRFSWNHLSVYRLRERWGRLIDRGHWR